MKFNQQLLVLYFLHLLRDQAKLEHLEPIKKACLYILPRSELQAIINYLTKERKTRKKPDFVKLTDYELLQWIANDYYIL
ncbi:MAG: hypothetical protein ACI8ZM_000917 [Crocinitomix sp.]|jgi:hypothetical protein